MKYQAISTIRKVLYVLTCAASVARAEVFKEITLEEAQKLAAQDGKIIFVDFFTTWCGPCKMLDSTTWKDPAVMSLLEEKTIALRIDAEKYAEIASRYQVNAYPTLALIRSNGDLIDSFVGYRDSALFISDFTKVLSGTTSFFKDRQSTDREAQALLIRLKNADLAVDSGKNEDVLRELLWLFDEGMVKYPRLAGVRVSAVPAAIGRLAKKYEPASKALKERRDLRKSNFSNNADSAREFAVLNTALGEDEVTVAALESLKKGEPIRELIAACIFDQLVELRRYDIALEGRSLDQYTEFKKMIEAQFPEEMKKQAVIDLAAKQLEVLSGSGHIDEAKALIADFAKDPDSNSVISLFKIRLQRSGHPELL